MIKSIPVEEFRERHRRAKSKVRERGLDALLVHSNEADFANVRYLSEYWSLPMAAPFFSLARRVRRSPRGTASFRTSGRSCITERQPSLTIRMSRLIPSSTSSRPSV